MPYEVFLGLFCVFQWQEDSEHEEDCRHPGGCQWGPGPQHFLGHTGPYICLYNWSCL